MSVRLIEPQCRDMYELHFDTAPSLAQLQSLVNGYIELVHVPGHENEQFVVNEDAVINELEINTLASYMVGQTIYGTMVYLTDNHLID